MTQRRAARTVALVVLLLAGTACSNTKFNAIAPGADAQPPVVVPDAVDVDASGYVVHLDPTVLLWARDAKVDLRSTVRRGVATIAEQLDATPTDVSISAGSYRVIPDVGIGGSTDPRTGEVIVSMDARSPLSPRELLTTWLPLVLAHELHHSARVLDGPGYGTTLLETMVSEGAAEAFVRDVYPDAPPIPWVRPLPDATERRLWREAQRWLDEPDDTDVYERWFLGKDDLPRWAGYRLGYAIARAYLRRHTDVDAGDLASIETAEIFRGSAYEPA